MQSHSNPAVDWRALGAKRQVRNRKLFVVDVGPRDDPAPLLFVHGFPTSAQDFAPTLAALSHRRCVLLDLLGFGLSDKPWPHDYSLLEQTDFVSALAQQLGLLRVHLVAHDMGDTVVQELLGRALDGLKDNVKLVPFEIASVTLLNGGVLVDQIHPIWSQRLLRSPLGPLMGGLPRPIARRAFLQSMRRIAGENAPESAILDEQFELTAHDGGLRLLPHLIGYMKERKIHRKRWRRSLMTHPFPMQLVWGDADPINRWAVTETIVRERPSTTAVRLAGVGHYPQLERPREVAERISAFVTQNP